MDRDAFFKVHFPGLSEAVYKELDGYASKAQKLLQDHYDIEAANYKDELLDNGFPVRFNGLYGRQFFILLGEILPATASKEAKEFASCLVPIELIVKTIRNILTGKSSTFQGELLFPNTHFLSHTAIKIIKDVLTKKEKEMISMADAANSSDMDVRMFGRLAAAVARKLAVRIDKEMAALSEKLDHYQRSILDVLGGWPSAYGAH